MKQYSKAVHKVFGPDVDYAQIVKVYSGDPGAIPAGKYSPPMLLDVEKKRMIGFPDPFKISTSYVESQNLTMRMHIRRLTRLTNGFSKKLANFKAAIGLHFGYYNFVKRHSTLKTTPCMAAGVTRNVWTVADLIERAV
jgi:3-methyladenine DNA glycosylase/8-oxoguanine DNA glycosylase